MALQWVKSATQNALEVEAGGFSTLIIAMKTLYVISIITDV
jgi:hypothetical protein